MDVAQKPRLADCAWHEGRSEDNRTQRRQKGCSATGPRALIGQRPDITNQARPAHETAGAEHAEEGERDARNRMQQRRRPREAVRSGEALGRWMWLKSHVWPTALARREERRPPHPTQAEGVQRKRPESADRAKA